MAELTEGLRAMLSGAAGLLRLELFVLGDRAITVASVLTSLFIVVASLTLSRFVRRGLRRILEQRGLVDPRSFGTVSTLLHYAILVVGFAVALDVIGIDLAALFAAGAIFAIGLGFAMQSIAQNFVSGVILLSERSINPNDVIEFDGMIARVTRIGIRATIVRTRDGIELIVPNSALAQTAVKNYTLGDPLFRIGATVGVSYGSDMAKVREVLEAVADGQNHTEAGPPQVTMTAFGSHSVDWEVRVWTKDPWQVPVNRSKLHEAIWWGLKEAGITIAFPQLDVHFDPGVFPGAPPPSTEPPR